MKLKNYARLSYQLVFLAILTIITTNVVFAEECNLDGIWQTNKGLMEIKQFGNQVEGKYDKDQGTIKGTLDGGMLKASFTHKTTKGNVRFTLHNQCKTIKGLWHYSNNPTMKEERWYGDKVVLDQVHNPPKPVGSTVSRYADKVASCSWTGYYKTSKGNIKLEQEGYRVKGLYDDDQCTLLGYIDTSTIDGQITCGQKIKGRFRFIMNPLCDGFRGQEFDLKNNYTNWDGTKSTFSNVNKNTARVGNGSSYADQYIVCTWNGYWKTDIGTFLATQQGYKVTAQFKDGTKRKIIAYIKNDTFLEGYITDFYGKKLENIKIFMNPDCHGFNGNRNYGTLQNPPRFYGTRIETVGSNDVVKKIPGTSNQNTASAVNTSVSNVSTGSTVVSTSNHPTNAISAANTTTSIHSNHPAQTTQSANKPHPPENTKQNTCSWTGKWITNPPGEINITQNGNHFTGSYLLDNGKIEGNVVGNTLVGTWADGPSYKAPYDAGQIIYTMSPDCQSFTVDFRGGDDNMNLPWMKSVWSAKRAQ